MTASHLSSPAWHVATALVITLVAAATGRDGQTSASPRDRAAPVPQVESGTETYRGYRLDLSAPDAGPNALKHRQAFLAMTASAVQHRRLAREPFTHDELRRKQPVHDRYLARLFGAPGA